jgi:hypothetical protein
MRAEARGKFPYLGIICHPVIVVVGRSLCQGLIAKFGMICLIFFRYPLGKHGNPFVFYHTSRFKFVSISTADLPVALCPHHFASIPFSCSASAFFPAACQGLFIYLRLCAQFIGDCLAFSPFATSIPLLLLFSSICIAFCCSLFHQILINSSISDA